MDDFIIYPEPAPPRHREGDEFRTVDGVLVSEDGEKTAWFKDSEGNILALGSV